MKLAPLFIVLILAFSCNKNDDAIENPNPDGKGLLENQKITVSGLERNYHLYIPQNPINAPIVLLFHGNKSNNDEIIGIDRSFLNRDIKAPYKVWLTLAEQENIILVIPNGSEGSGGDNGWNDCRNDATGNPVSDDVLFSTDLIDFVVNQYEANAAKVYAVGTSNGGQMSIRLAHEIPNKLAAFAAVVAANPVDSQCANSTVPISALFMNGTEDPINPYAGGDMAGDRGKVFSAQETIDYWVDRNKIAATPITTDFTDTDTTDNCTVKKHLYTSGATNVEVAFYEVIGGGHTEPSIAERYGNLFKAIVKEQNGDIEMAEEVWNFFKNK
ncbi:prolyl oligopeptidase family serine peptidase [Maribacter sp.]|nr:prolyl oligopeptidase family serine peptidase [Maribacter sp.]